MGNLIFSMNRTRIALCNKVGKTGNASYYVLRGENFIGKVSTWKDGKQIAARVRNWDGEVISEWKYPKGLIPSDRVLWDDTEHAIFGEALQTGVLEN